MRGQHVGRQRQTTFHLELVLDSLEPNARQGELRSHYRLLRGNVVQTTMNKRMPQRMRMRVPIHWNAIE